jgi:ribose-phosphate pyrophosphokinase
MMPLVIAMPGTDEIAGGITRAGGFECGELETRRFPDREAYVRHRSDVAGRSVALVCTLDDPDPKLMTLLLAVASARDLGAVRVGLVAPYLAYMRQDRRFHDGEAVSARQFARILSREVDWLVTVDPHLHRIRRLEDVYTVPCEALHAGPLLAEWIGRAVPEPLLVGPDEESEQWVAAVAHAIGAPYVVAAKIRTGDREVRVTIPSAAEWPERTPVLVDDVASSGETLLAGLEILCERGERKPACAVVHGIFAGDSYQRISALCDPIATVNTIVHPSNRIDASALLAGAVTRLAAAPATNPSP